VFTFQYSVALIVGIAILNNRNYDINNGGITEKKIGKYRIRSSLQYIAV
jgi:hypothetical protein